MKGLTSSKFQSFQASE